MSKRWLLILLSGVLILSFTACTGASGNPTQAPTIEEESSDADIDDTTDMDTEDSQDDDSDADSAADGDTDEETVSINAAEIYSQRCSGCHGPEREGANAPALLPAVLTKDPSDYVNIITNGSGPMPSWGSRLSTDEISALVDFILSGAE